MTIIYIILLLGVISIITSLLMFYFFPQKITLQEMGISIGAGFIAMMLSLLINSISSSNDYIVHGSVIKKSWDITSCEHSYQVCRGSGKHRTCTTHYEHSHDYDWNVKTSIGTFTIDRIDRQGNNEPQRFTKVKIGDKVSDAESYTDHILNTYSIYNTIDLIDKKSPYYKILPTYPTIKDYYNTNLILTVGDFDKKLVKSLNDKLRNVMQELSEKVNNNTVIVLTRQPLMFAEYLKNAWNNGRKNDGIIVIGLDNSNTMNYVFVFGWSKNQMYHTKMKYELMDIGKLNIDTIDKIIYTVQNVTLKHFEQKNHDDFSYLEYNKKIDDGLIGFIILFQVLFQIGLMIYHYKTDNY